MLRGLEYCQCVMGIKLNLGKQGEMCLKSLASGMSCLMTGQ